MDDEARARHRQAIIDDVERTVRQSLMMSALRQWLALAVLFGAGLLFYLMGGMRSLGAAALGFSVFWLMQGIGLGYWLGHDGRVDRMVMALMRRIKERSAEEGDQAQ